ncbi:MAG: hypothetical protein AB8C84_11870 [Oligoflexales bacterium]
MKFSAVFFILFIGCQPTSPSQPENDVSSKNELKTQPDPNVNEPTEEALDNLDAIDSTSLELIGDLNPLDAALKISTPTLENIAAIQDVKAPSFSIKLENADFYQILRCQSDYQIRDYREQSIFERRQAWKEAFNNSYSCSLIAREGVNAIFQDLALQTGSFRYIINPCVSETRSSTGQQDCSYQLAISPVIEMQSPFKKLEREIYAEFQDLQSQITARYQRAETVVERLAQVQTKCNYEWVDRQIYLTHLKGILSAGATLLIGAKFGFSNFMYLFIPSIVLQTVTPFVFPGEGEGSYQGPECKEARIYQSKLREIMDRSWFEESQSQMVTLIDKLVTIHQGQIQLDEDILKKHTEGLQNYVLRDNSGPELDDYLTGLSQGQAIKLPTIQNESPSE